MQHVEDQQGQLAAAMGQLGGLSLDPAPPATVVVHEFATEPGDHAETPLEAYQHIAPVLERLAKCGVGGACSKQGAAWGVRCGLGHGTGV